MALQGKSIFGSPLLATVIQPLFNTISSGKDFENIGFTHPIASCKAGVFQESFADRCGVHRTFMGTIERGESNLSFSNLVKVSEGLGITLSQLLSGIEKSVSEASKGQSRPKVNGRGTGKDVIGRVGRV